MHESHYSQLSKVGSELKVMGCPYLVVIGSVPCY